MAVVADKPGDQPLITLQAASTQSRPGLFSITILETEDWEATRNFFEAVLRKNARWKFSHP